MPFSTSSSSVSVMHRGANLLLSISIHEPADSLRTLIAVMGPCCGPITWWSTEGLVRGRQLTSSERPHGAPDVLAFMNETNVRVGSNSVIGLAYLHVCSRRGSGRTENRSRGRRSAISCLTHCNKRGRRVAMTAQSPGPRAKMWATPAKPRALGGLEVDHQLYFQRANGQCATRSARAIICHATPRRSPRRKPRSD